MKATHFEFRYRVAIICTLYFLGFFAPWARLGAGANPNPPRLWSWIAIEAARTNLLSVSAAYFAVTAAAVALAVVGAWLRVWGTAYLGSFIMKNPVMQAESVLAAGPYRHLRNPLYVGMLLSAFAVALLMPVSGALVFMIAMLLFTARLIGGEEAYLTRHLGASYLEYRRMVRSVVPGFRSRIAAGGVRPQWLQAVLAEFFPLGTAICFVVLAWSYDAALLTRCIIVCFGISLILQALMGGRRLAAE